MVKIHHRDASTGKTTVTSYGHSSPGTSKGLSDFKAATSTESKSTTQSDAALETEKEKLLKQARFNANVKSLMNAGFTQREAEDLAAQYFDDTTVSIGKILSNAPQNSTVKLSDGSVTTVTNAANMAASTQTVASVAQVHKLQSAIDDLAEQYKDEGISKQRYLQQVASKIRTYDSKTQNYLLNYSKKAAGIYGEARETAAFLVDVADAYSMLPAGVAYSVKHPETITAAMSQSVRDTASGTVEEFKTNPRRATTNLLAIVLVTHGVIKVGSKVSSKLPATKTYIKNVSKVTVKTTKVSSKKLRNVIDKEIVAVERRTNTQLYSKAKQYEKTYKSYVKSKSSSGKAAAKRELSKIENEINKIIKEKNAAQRNIKSVVQKYKNESYSAQTMQRIVADLKERKRVAKRSLRMKKKSVKTAIAEKKTSVNRSKPAKTFRKGKKAIGEKKKVVKTTIKKAKKSIKGIVAKELRSTQLRISRAFKKPSKYGLTKRQLERLQQELKIASDRYKRNRISALELRKKIREINKQFDAYEKAERARELKPVNIKIKKSGSTTVNKQGKKIRNMGAEFRKASKEQKGVTVSGKSGQALLTKTENAIKQVQKQKLKVKQQVEQAQKQASKSKTIVMQAQKVKTKQAQKTKLALLLKTKTLLMQEYGQIQEQAQVMRTLSKTLQVSQRQGLKTTQVTTAITTSKAAVTQLTGVMSSYKTALKQVNSAISAINAPLEMPVVVPKLKVPKSKPRTSKKKASKRYTPREVNNRVSSFKSIFG